MPQQLFDQQGNPIQEPTKKKDFAEPRIELFDQQGNPLDLGIPHVADPRAGEKLEEGAKKLPGEMGRMGAAALPFAASFAPGWWKLLSVPAATKAKHMLQTAAPSIFGEPPGDTPEDYLFDYAKDLGTNVVLPGAVGGVLRGGEALINAARLAGAKGALPLTLKSLPAVRRGAIEELGNRAAGTGMSPAAQQAMQSMTPAATAALQQQIAQLAKPNIMDPIVKFSQGRYLFGGPGLLSLLGMRKSAGLLASTQGGIALTDKLMERLMLNPATRTAVTDAMNTPLHSPYAGAVIYGLQRAIAGALDYETLPEK